MHSRATNRRFGRVQIGTLLSLVFIASISPSAGAADAESNETIIAPQAARAAKAIQIPQGFTLTTVASEPNLANGVAFCFDPAGRIFVAETYRVKKGVEDNRDHMDWLDDDLAARSVADRREYVKRRMGERIGEFESASEQVRLLEDRDADGLYEHASVFSTGYKAIEEINIIIPKVIPKVNFIFPKMSFIKIQICCEESFFKMVYNIRISAILRIYSLYMWSISFFIMG
jgi:hypothetical protein